MKPNQELKSGYFKIPVVSVLYSRYKMGPSDLAFMDCKQH